MFIRPCHRKRNGKRHAYWALVESYRTDRGPRQRIVAYLGQLNETERRGVKHAAQGKRMPPREQLRLFDHKGKPETEWIEVDTANVRVENQLDFGGPWLALELIRKLKLDALLDKLMPRGKQDIPWSRMALVLAISRLCKPSSELHIAEHYYGKTAMPELLGIPSEKVYDQRLKRRISCAAAVIVARKRRPCTTASSSASTRRWKSSKPVARSGNGRRKRSIAESVR